MRIKIFFFIFLSLFLFFPSFALAQDFDFNKAYGDYQFAFETYLKSNSEFTESRDFYLKNQTLTLKEDARKKLLIMLKDRDQLMSVYLLALRMKIIEGQGLSQDEKSKVLGKIESEISWYKEHKEKYKDSDPTNDLFNKSSESKGRYDTITQPIVYDSLFQITLSEEVDIRQDHEVIFSALKQVIDTGVASGQLKPDPFGRWFTDVEGVGQILKQKETDAKIQIQKIYEGQYYSTSNTYEAATNILSSALVNLRQLNSFVIELLTSIKNQQ